MANAIRWIARKAKELRKQNPNAHRTWNAYVKQASNMWARKKSAPVKRSPKKKVARKVRRKVSSITIREKTDKPRTRAKKVYQVTRTKKGQYKSFKRVGSAGGSNLLPIALGVVGVGLLYLLFKNNRNTPMYPAGYPSNYPTYQPTGNQYRDQNAQKIIAYATAGGLAIDAIARLIESLTNKSDNDIQQIYDTIDTTGTVPEYAWV